METIDLPYIKSAELARRMELLLNMIGKMKALMDWYNQHPTVTRKELLEKYDELVGVNDYHKYLLASAKKKERADTLRLIYERTLLEGEPILEQIKAEQVVRKEQEMKRAKAKETFAMLSQFLSANEMGDNQMRFN